MNAPAGLWSLVVGDDQVADEVDVRIIEAALEQFTLVGIKRASTDDIARRAGVNRTTLYRRMGSKDAIVRAAVLYEVRRMLTRIEAEIGEITDVAERIAEGCATTVTLLRENALLKHLLAVDRDEILPQVTIDAGAALRAGTFFVADQIRRARTELGLPDPPDVDGLAAILVRLVHSLVLIPDGPPDLETREQLREFARLHILPMITT
ncbi:TetR/AcrR family transcriptional regulator [Nocardia sp. NPDC051570]|uniref:TetR/AcrR family transcriptional regulator n=1 Tax=Nocardia sp. NPDC051570 TaxID=3364324 RepID=UPI0037BAEF1B